MKKLYCWENGIYKSIEYNRIYVTNHNRYYRSEGFKSIETIPCCNLLKVANFNEKWGVIDLHGNIIIPLQFKEIQVFSPTLFFVIEEKTIDCYDEKDIEKFRNVVHKEQQITDCCSLGFHETTRVTCEYIGIYNDKGEELHPPTIETIEFLKGNSYFKILEGGLYGIIDLEGKCIIPQIYTWLEQITFKGEILFEGNRYDKKELIKINGEILPLESLGHFEYKLKIDNKYSLYNKYSDNVSFYDDIQWISDDDEISEYYAPPTYGYLKVKNDNRWGIICKGKEILSPIYDEIINEDRISSLLDDYGCLIKYSVISDGKKIIGCINNHGYIFFTENFDDIKLVDLDIYAIKKNGLWGIIDLKSNYILQPEYDDIIVEKESQRYFSKDIIIKKGNKSGVFNLKEGLIIPPIYDIIQYCSDVIYAKQDSFLYKFSYSGTLESKLNLLTDYSQGYENENSDIFTRDSSDIDLSTDEKFYRINYH